MKTLAALTLSLFLSAGTAFADSPKDANPEPAKAAAPAKPKPAKKAEKSDSAIAAQLEELRQALQSQQEQLQLLKEELAKRDRQIDEAREAAAAANSSAVEANTRATEAVNASAEVKSSAAALNTTVNDLKASNDVLKSTVETEQAEAKKAAEEGPSTIKYKGVSITPGGFLAAETVWRNRATGSDINTSFTGIPYPGVAMGKVSEFNFTARQSRATLLVEGKAGIAKFTGYYEGDFLGTGVTSNNRQSNSYVFRQRQVWGSVNLDGGFGISGGQMWSLVTESRKGILNRSEAFPLQIDPQYIVGWAWARAYGFRVYQNWDKFAIGFSIEGPQTTFGGRGFPTNFFVSSPGAGGGLYNFADSGSNSGYTTNRAPDFLIKAAFDPGWGHYEVVGILSDFRNRIYPCGSLPAPAAFPTATCTSATSVQGAFNDSRVGGGAGATARFPVIAKKLDLAVHVQGGYGVGRYSSAQLADVTFRPDGSIAPIHSYAWLGTLEAHPNAKLDIYAYFGGEYAARTAYTFNNAAGHPVAVGFGSALFNNSGCSTEVFPVAPVANTINGSSPTIPQNVSNCGGDIHQIVEGTLGFWYKVYNGPKGRVQFGPQYSYITKYGWSGNNFNSATGVAGPSLRPHAVDNMLFTGFRYYIP